MCSSSVVVPSSPTPLLNGTSPNTSSTMAAFLDYLMFACTAGASVLAKKNAASSDKSCALKNSAFVFVKPHANTKATQGESALVFPMTRYRIVLPAVSHTFYSYRHGP